MMNLQHILIKVFSLYTKETKEYFSLEGNSVTEKKKARARVGWVMVEVLCSVIIVSLLAAQIAESSGMMARASARGLETRTRILDFGSIAEEVERVNSSGRVFRGSWEANAEKCEGEKGIYRVAVSVSLKSSEAPDTIHWIAWDIKGRAR